jgi:hypothetical protein
MDTMKNSGQVDLLEKEVVKLKTGKEALETHVQNLLTRVVQLNNAAIVPQQQSPTGLAPTPALPNLLPQDIFNLRPIDMSVLDDDTAILALVGLPLFDEDAEGQLQVSLVGSGIPVVQERTRNVGKS